MKFDLLDLIPISAAQHKEEPHPGYALFNFFLIRRMF